MNFFCIFAVMKEKEELRQRLKANPRLKKWLDYVIMNQRDARPRWYIRLLAPFYQHRGRDSKIYSSVRMDTPPYRSSAMILVLVFTTRLSVP